MQSIGWCAEEESNESKSYRQVLQRTLDFFIRQLRDVQASRLGAGLDASLQAAAGPGPAFKSRVGHGSEVCMCSGHTTGKVRSQRTESQYAQNTEKHALPAGRTPFAPSQKRNLSGFGRQLSDKGERKGLSWTLDCLPTMLPPVMWLNKLSEVAGEFHT